MLILSRDRQGAVFQIRLANARGSETLILSRDRQGAVKSHRS
jgi:hypothetical protein